MTIPSVKLAGPWLIRVMKVYGFRAKTGRMERLDTRINLELTKPPLPGRRRPNWGGAISQSSVTGFSAFIGNTDSNETRFAIEIENEGWFVTTESWTNAIGGASDFQNDALKIEFGFTTDGSAWRTLNPDPNDGSFVFSGDQSANALGSSLPAGDIIAAGVYMDNPSGGNRFDDFTVVPEPSTYVALLGLAALGFVFFRRCRK